MVQMEVMIKKAKKVRSLQKLSWKKLKTDFGELMAMASGGGHENIGGGQNTQKSAPY